jgi:hypothetical protein
MFLFEGNIRLLLEGVLIPQETNPECSTYNYEKMCVLFPYLSFRGYT